MPNKPISMVKIRQVLRCHAAGLGSKTIAAHLGISRTTVKKTTILTSQVPVKNWYDLIGDKTVADAVLDRLVHNVLRIELHGESLRKLLSMK